MSTYIKLVFFREFEQCKLCKFYLIIFKSDLRCLWTFCRFLIAKIYQWRLGGVSAGWVLIYFDILFTAEEFTLPCMKSSRDLLFNILKNRFWNLFWLPEKRRAAVQFTCVELVPETIKQILNNTCLCVQSKSFNLILVTSDSGSCCTSWASFTSSSMFNTS